MRWFRYGSLILVLLYGLLNLFVALFAVPRATPRTVTEVEGRFMHTFEGGEKDVVIALLDSDQKYYVNRGYDDHPVFDVVAFEQEVQTGDTVILTAYTRWLPPEGETKVAAVPLAGVRTAETVYLDTEWMAGSTAVRNSWFVAIGMGLLALLLLLPELRRFRSNPPANGHAQYVPN